jgi:hypothetical protein
MRRDWELIRSVLLEVESLSESDRNTHTYGGAEDQTPQEQASAEQALLLWEAGYIKGYEVTTSMGTALLSPELTWQGHDLLDMLRSAQVWERVKGLAQSKGIELSFDAVKLLHERVLTDMLGVSEFLCARRVA